MKPTHTAKLADDTTIRLTMSENFWCSGKLKWRKETGEPAGKNPGPKLTLSSIELLPTRMTITAPNGTIYDLVKVDTKKDLMILRNDKGLEFETHISKATGYKVTKYFD